MSTLANGWIVAGLYDPATDDAVQLNDLDRSRCEYVSEEIANELTNMKSQSGTHLTITLATYQEDGQAQVAEWARKKTPLNFIILSKGLCPRIHRPVSCTYRPSPVASRFEGDTVWMVTFDFVAEDQLYCDSANLLHEYMVPADSPGFLLHNVEEGVIYTGWKDDDNNEIPDGWSRRTDIQMAGVDFNVDGELTAFFQTSSGIFFQRKLIIPVSGIKYTYSEDLIDDGDNSLVFRYKDNTGTLQTNSYSRLGLPVGRTSQIMTSPAGTYHLEIDLFNSPSGNPGDLATMARPCLRVGDSDEYIAY